ncbi:MAG TPA: hypothetical protein VFS41_01925 [Edaphobacter sp.]|nr:hypothetical protein [Edaphobacter sp.]
MKIVIIGMLLFIALVPIAVAAGKWLEQVSQEFEEAENRENE